MGKGLVDIRKLILILVFDNCVMVLNVDLVNVVIFVLFLNKYLLGEVLSTFLLY